ncbi:hypothetical protein LCGC14_2424050 [marine sediment metagenome]|uniref:Uncharacterized protein n=1 Tax=marine sediment metagenome TaxID=412755 RepID=A0A0F9BNV4_9ZZZZ
MYKLTVQKKEEATLLYPDIESGVFFLFGESSPLYLKLDIGFVEIGSGRGFAYGVDFDGYADAAIQKVVPVEIIVRKA